MRRIRTTRDDRPAPLLLASASRPPREGGIVRGGTMSHARIAIRRTTAATSGPSRRSRSARCREPGPSARAGRRGRVVDRDGLVLAIGLARRMDPHPARGDHPAARPGRPRRIGAATRRRPHHVGRDGAGRRVRGPGGAGRQRAGARAARRRRDPARGRAGRSRTHRQQPRPGDCLLALPARHAARRPAPVRRPVARRPGARLGRACAAIAAVVVDFFLSDLVPYSGASSAVLLAAAFAGVLLPRTRRDAASRSRRRPAPGLTGTGQSGLSCRIRW